MKRFVMLLTLTPCSFFLFSCAVQEPEPATARSSAIVTPGPTQPSLTANPSAPLIIPPDVRDRDALRKKYRELYDVCLRLGNQLEVAYKQYPNAQISHEQLGQLREATEDAARAMDEAHWQLGLEPAMPRNMDAPTKEESEAMSMERYYIDQYAQYWRHRLYKQRLARMLELLPAYQGHPALERALIAIGDAFAKQYPAQAVQYYLQCANRAKNGEMTWDESEALQRLTDVYEKLGKYKEAIDCISKARHVGWCGNGGAAFDNYQRFTILRLRRYDEGKEKVYAELWDMLRYRRSFSTINGISGIVRDVRNLYGDRDRELLEKQLRWEVAHPYVSRPGEQYYAKEFARLLTDLQELLAFEHRVENAPDKELLSLLGKCLDRKDREYVSGIDVYWYYENSDSYRYYPESILMREFLKRGKKLAPELLEYNSNGYSDLSLYILARLGGKGTADFLAGRSKQEHNAQLPYACYYAILLTAEPAARQTVEAITKSSDKFRARQAARALREFDQQER